MKRRTAAIHSNVSAKGFHLQSTTRYPTPTLNRNRSATSCRGTDPMGHGMGSRCRVRGDRSCGCTFPKIITAPQFNFSNRTFNSVCKCVHTTVGPLEVVPACPPLPQTPSVCNPAKNLDTQTSSDYLTTLHKRMCMVRPKRMPYNPYCSS